MNRSNIFQVLAENLKPKHFDQPKPKQSPLFDSNALTGGEKAILRYAIRNLFDYGKYLGKADISNLISAAEKIGMKDLAEQMKSDLK